MDKTNDTKKEIKMLNNPFDWALQIGLMILFPAAIVLAIVLGARDKWETWVIVALIAALFLYFAGMLIYKIYRARMCIVKISESGITFGYAFKPYHISADELMVALVDNGKERAKGKMFVRLYDEQDIGTTVILSEKRIKTLTEVAPPPFIEFFVQICDTPALKTALDTAPERMIPYIQKEIDAREQAILEEKRQAADRQRAQEKARQRKKNKRKKKSRK